MASPAPKPGIATGFVRKLYRILDNEGSQGIAWDTTGESFSIHDENIFKAEVLPRYFARGRLVAFRKQLDAHGFTRIATAYRTLASGALHEVESYQHEYFQRGNPGSLNKIVCGPKSRRHQRGWKTRMESDSSSLKLIARLVTTPCSMPDADPRDLLQRPAIQRGAGRKAQQTRNVSGFETFEYSSDLLDSMFNFFGDSSAPAKQ